jgi:hypothetical protein
MEMGWVMEMGLVSAWEMAMEPDSELESGWAKV